MEPQLARQKTGSPGTEREGAFLHKLPNWATGVLDWVGFAWYIIFSNKSLRAARIHS